MEVTPFPNFLVVGAAKCGTTSLYHYLVRHPQVYMCPIKEPNHFSTDIDPVNFSPEYKQIEKEKRINIKEYVNSDFRVKHWGSYVHDREDYTKLFRFAKDKKAIGEISNSYLFSAVAAKNIHDEFPEMKIVMVLRNPVERVYSHYLANLRDGKTILSFRKELEKDAAKTEKGWAISHTYLEMGLYHDQVQRYLQLFPENQIRIYLYDDLKKDTPGLVRNLFAFLGISTDSNINFSEKHNEAKMPKNRFLVHLLTRIGIKRRLLHLLPEKWQTPVKSAFFSDSPVPKMTAEDRNWLIDFYKEDIAKLSDLIHRDLSSWTVKS